jgi:nucleoside-diphosphate-sugar epimerase
VLVTGATGYLGWRTASLLAARGHEVTGLTRPGAVARAASRDLPVVECDAADPAARELVAGHDAVLHFAGMPDPARSRADPAHAVLLNAGTTANLLDGCAEHGARLIYPSSLRAGVEPAPDAYALSKRLGEEACRLHRAPSAIVRLTSIFGPGQVRAEGATGAIAAFAARALAGEPIVIPGNPRRTRDFVYVDDFVAGLEGLLDGELPDGPVLAASGAATPLLEAAELVREAAGTAVEIELPGGELPAGEDASYAVEPQARRLPLRARPLAAGIAEYVEWLRDHPAT